MNRVTLTQESDTTKEDKKYGSRQPDLKSYFGKHKSLMGVFGFDSIDL
jgi:hypothetical protein